MAAVLLQAAITSPDATRQRWNTSGDVNAPLGLLANTHKGRKTLLTFCRRAFTTEENLDIAAQLARCAAHDAFVCVSPTVRAADKTVRTGSTKVCPASADRSATVVELADLLRTWIPVARIYFASGWRNIQNNSRVGNIIKIQTLSVILCKFLITFA